MKEKLNSYQPTPDPELWDQINGHLRRRVLRRSAAVAGGVLLIAGAVLLLAPGAAVSDGTQSLTASQSATSVVSQPIAASETAPADLEVSVVVATPAPEVARPAAIPATADRTVQPAATGLSDAEIQQLLAQSEVHPTAARPAAVQSDPAVHRAETAVPVAKSTPAAASKNASASPDIPVEPDVTDLSIPNVISPNDPDVRNHAFTITTNTPLTAFKLYIYNRGGRLVYHTTDVNSAWDGTHQGTPVSQGAYVYVIYYSDKDGRPHTLKGTVTVLR